MSIYVEIFIRGNLEDIWEKTQQPTLHKRWDLRFSEIDYLPCVPGEAQRFFYATRVGAGIRIEGSGESTGHRNDSNGKRTSALKFWSKDPKSLIEWGSGYWKYVPVPGGVRFITSYDYRTRFGAIGKIVDKLFFRPLLGWATAWSFDRLRLWVERTIPPETSRKSAFAYSLCRLALAFVWLYQGAIPKLIYQNRDELRMLRDAGLSDRYLPKVLSSLGWVEVCIGMILIIFWNSRWPFWLTIFAMLAAILGVSVVSPGYLNAAFNPASLNIAVAALAGAGLLVGTDLPTARNCHRKSSEVES
jgi:hypothetical protein